MAYPLLLGRYSPIQTLGQGGSGTVTLCWDTRIQRRVAIKRLPLAARGSSSQIPGLLEARTAAMLNHPSIVSVIDFETEGDEALLIMEAIEGASLSQLIDDTPPGAFDLDIIASVTISIANALCYAHENQVLHLDIKPDNILITVNGTTKVSDFGISELAGAGGFSEALGGTIGYMPPEQMRGEPLDERCDEFAFAVVVYEMLTGENPFAKKTLNASINAIERREAALPSSVRDDIDPDLDFVLGKALSPNRNERYASVRAFVDALLPWLGDAHEGIARLREVLTFDDEEPEIFDEPAAAPGALDALASWARIHLGRLVAAVACWWVAGTGMVCFDELGAPMAFACALLVAVAALAKPALGAILALICLVTGLVATLSFPPLMLGLALAAAGLCWIVPAGRELLASRSFAVDVACALGCAPLACLHLTILIPFLTGGLLSWKRALACSVVSVFMLLSLACASGSGSLMWCSPLPVSEQQANAVFVELVTKPSTWIVFFGWIVATVLMSLACRGRTRVLFELGAVLCLLVLFVSQVLAQWTTTGVWGFPSLEFCVACVLAFAATSVCCVLCTPSECKGEV